MQRMNQQCAYPGVFRNRDGAFDSILKQSSAELLPLGAAINRQPPEHHHGHGIWHVAPDLARGQRVRRGTRGQGVVAPYAITLVEHDEGSAGAAQLVGKRTALEPFVQ